MEESINQRLKKFISNQNINEPDTYKYIGTRKQVWNGWINAGEAIPLNKIQKILAMFPLLNARWLLIGEGQMLNDTEQIKQENELNEDAPKYLKSGCPRCEVLQAKLDGKIETIAAHERTIAILTGEPKKEKRTAGSAQ